MQIGIVKEIWRYPVKSMGGERITEATIGVDGIDGDRGYATRDEGAGEIRGAKNIPALLSLQARYLAPPRGDSIPPVLITLPDGSTVRSDDPQVSAQLSATVGRTVTLWPRQPAAALDHYRRGAPEGGDMMADLRRIFGLDADDPLPPVHELPPELFQYVSPLGTYFDAFPLHLLSTATMATLSTRHPAGRFDVRRFRPNLLMDLGAARGCPEEEWRDRVVRIGGVEVRVTMPAMRCVMTMTPQPDLPKDPLILRTIVKHNRSNGGVYATISTPGTVREGDPIALA